MREILFRGKLKNSVNSQTPAGTWVYGGHCFWRDGACIHEKDSAIGLFVDPETVGQYTGVKDKSGRKIFEGDVVVDNRGCISVVEYVNGGFHSQDDAYSLGYYAMLSRVIGNIHDDPELLKGG